MQPLIAPLYHGVSVLEMIALLTDGAPEGKLPDAYDLVRSYWKTKATGNFETWWARALHDGVVPNTAAPVLGNAPQPAAITAAVTRLPPAASA